ncbi:hypothetical protein PHYBLDRAFT_167503 [Phycomyces blakesleeanus NRRL 1555(-)]|uniref:Homeodomain-like DNA binding domain-containing transcription factor n=1 Tax=Phycomyces blakesleeanus (strain ATCC 8743b / DSM 1359 / FGSC 10004 / NBRC 33097 / NRRL 1555) TaxID=763407 RepID=A0A162XIW5_PHYB8|nr:hypothetical protein PHYBLDRAFT_167503 [Phycomyces blakesleeanus NRRL 1555(-)]OAD75185.1 hypothetical protein PHYBLDRAFT_167503 [Phycomyces blakesleeanus NRRL 1555(-)]|eukprot:XP_018293225.1 hypothetical protein PHYBLDRAFT_167503 [Phycomyces blakesleeanus NRRL 1555(-)]
MSTYFFYENGQGKIYDEQGNDAMEWSEEAQPSEQEQMRGELDENMNEVYLRVNEEDNNVTKKSYKVYSPVQKVLFLYYLQVKLFKAAKAARFSGVSERTGQQWAKRIRDEPEWNIFEKQTNKDKRKTGQLQEEHKEFIIDLFDKNPQTRVKDVVVSLERSFANFSLKETSVRNFMTNECNLSFKRATLQTKERNSGKTLQKRFEWLRVTEKPKQRKVDGVGRKRKQTSNQKRREGTKTESIYEKSDEKLMIQAIYFRQATTSIITEYCSTSLFQ